MKNLGEAVNSWDSVIVYMLSIKLDAYIKWEWDKKALQLAKTEIEDRDIRKSSSF